MSTPLPGLARLRVVGEDNYVKNFKVVDHDFVVVTTPHLAEALLMPTLYATAIGTFLRILNFDVNLEEQ